MKIGRGRASATKVEMSGLEEKGEDCIQVVCIDGGVRFSVDSTSLDDKVTLLMTLLITCCEGQTGSPSSNRDYLCDTGRSHKHSLCESGLSFVRPALFLLRR